MPASVSLRKDFSAEELRRLARSAWSVSQGGVYCRFWRF